MKRLLLLGGWLVLSLPAFAQATLQTGEELFRQGKFSAALNVYEQLLKNHPKDPFVYYNIGNCYFKMGSTGLAAANYFRAFKLAPRDADIRHNLALALASGGERFVPSGIPVVLHQAYFYLSYAELKGLTYGLWWLVSLLLVVCILRRKWNVLATIGCVLLLGCNIWLYSRAQLEQRATAVIAAPVAEIRSGPGTNFPASASVAQGHLVTILDEKDAWYEVAVTSQGIKGWMEKNTIEKI